MYIDDQKDSERNLNMLFRKLSCYVLCTAMFFKHNCFHSRLKLNKIEYCIVLIKKIQLNNLYEVKHVTTVCQGISLNYSNLNIDNMLFLTLYENTYFVYKA